MLEALATSMAVAGALLAVLALYAAWRRDTPTGWSLAAVLGSVAWWGLAYAVELASDAVATKSLWGDLKYLGVSTLGPSFLCFVLQYTGRGHRVTRRLLLLLAIEPVLVMAALAVPATHDLVHHYPPRVAPDQLVVVETGPLFWVHLVYVNALLVVATALFMTSMVRLARTYRRLAVVLMASGLLPWVANFLHNGEVGPFARIDLTPFAFSLTGGVLVWVLFRERLPELAPLARSAVVESMVDAVFVLDAFGRVADVNPAGVAVLSATRGSLVGRRLTDVLPQEVRFAVAADDGIPEVHVDGPGGRRSFDVRRQQLTDRTGRPAGELVVLRDVTERVRARTELQHVLAEQQRVATALQASMVPGRLPDVPGCELASAYHPAGDGSEVGGDFLDVFALGPGTWGFVLGDVSGKGAQAAAVSAAARYTIRALADPRHAPSRTLRAVNARLVGATDPEQFCTVVYGQVTPLAEGVRLTFCLAGHPLPIVAHHGAGTTSEQGVPGTVLGLLEDPDLDDTTVVLGPGDLLCAFTDGLVESRRGPVMFETDRVETVLSRHADEPTASVVEHLVGAVRGFHGGELEDDLAVLLIRAAAGSAGDGTPELAGRAGQA